MTERLGGRIQLVGDDLLVTNIRRLSCGIRLHAANAILVKVNQIGTLSEAMDAVEMAQKAGYRAVILSQIRRDRRFIYRRSGSGNRSGPDQSRRAVQVRKKCKIQPAPQD